MRALVLIAAAALPAGGTAEWAFSPPAVVNGATEPGVFPHLEAAGRQSLAVARDGTVAVVWEDNRSGRPQVYLATRAPDAERFTPPRSVSEGGPAYEPAIASAGDGFVVAWEQNQGVLARFVGATFGPIGTLSDAGAQATLASDGRGGVRAAWSEREERFGRILVATIERAGDAPSATAKRPADSEMPRGQQLYPALAVTPSRSVVAWEDRRHGHTRLYTVHGEEDLSGLRRLNELPSTRSVRFGRGSGVTRVALARGGDRVAAVWMDKRAFRGGYDIYAAVSTDGGETFGPNELAQDLFGENQPQWHPDIAVSATGRIVTAWDDPRDGTPDIWLSWRTGEGEWSSDITFDGGSGPGAQSHPVIAFGPEGRLHIAWVHRPEEGPVSIRYSKAEWVE